MDENLEDESPPQYEVSDETLEDNEIPPGPPPPNRNFLRLLPIQHSIQPMEEVDDDTEDEHEEIEAERDRLFEQYIREIDQVPPAELRENFNTELPTEHSYLGNMDPVSGIDFFEVGKVYKIPISGHDSIIFPGETLPMIMAESIFDPSTTSTDGLTFGLVCWEHATKDKVFGVTCQVYEQGVDSQGNITIKSRAHQRFKIVRQKDGSYMRPNQRRGYFADVKILPEIVLPDPLLQINSCPSVLRLVQNQSEYGRIRRFVASSSPWPKFVYDQYETNKVQRKVERFLAMLKIDTVPSDPVLLSFWLARNIPITNEKRRTIFTLDSVNARMLIIGKALDFLCYFCCRRCKTKVANYDEIFAMSKQGVQSSYCNPSGYIHETLTVYNIIESSTYLLGRPSTEFSWFPGYAWQITQCQGCNCHLGWKFIATKKNLMPRSFYGLSGKSITVENIYDRNLHGVQMDGSSENEHSLTEDSD